MRKIFSLLMATLFCVVLWAQAPAGTTLFSENFGGYAANDVPSGSVSSLEGSRIVYGDATVTYTTVNGSSNSKIYAENVAGGTSPEILIGKSNGSLTIAGIPSGGAKAITVSYKQNKQKLKVEATTTGYTGSKEEKPAAVGTNSFDITVADGAAATFDLVFTCTGSSNVRVDDILVTVKTAGESAGGGETPQPTHTYTVAGDNTTLFGTAWAPTNEDNDMALVEGLYTWEKTNQTLPAGNVAFKVCEDHAWTVAYPASDYQLNIPEAGIYTITITYNPADNNAVNAVAQKTGDAVVIPTVAMHGNFTGNWTDTENFAVAEGNETASLTLNLAAGDYEFGMRIGGSSNWTANGAAFTRDNNSAVIVAGQGNITLDADAAGEYTFTWTYASNTLTITYPEFVPPTYTYADGYYLIGLDMMDWTMEYMPTEGRLFAANPDNEGEYQLTITLAADQQFKVVSVQKDQIKTWYPDGMDNNFIVDAAHAGEKTVYFRPDGQGGEGWHYGCIYVAANEDQPAPVADFTQPFTLKFNGTGESGKDNSVAFAADVAAIFDAASAPYVASVETANKTYAGRPIADDNSSVKFGTSSAQGSLSFTLAQAIEVDSIIVNATQYGNNAAKVTVNGTEFDLTAGNKKPQDCKITPTGAVSAITIAQSGSERIYLRNVRVYPHVEAPQPQDPTVAVMGSMNNWAAEIPFVLSDDKTYASLTVEDIGADNYEFKFVINGEWRSNGYTYHRNFTGAAGITGNDDANMIFQADQDGQYTFYWYFANDSAAIVYPEYIEPVYDLENGYYLVGDKYNWTPAAERLFLTNTETEGEYYLADVVLGKDDSIKVVKVVNDVVTDWYPNGDNYVVDAAHAGTKTIYFNPTYQEAWGNNIYVEANQEPQVEKYCEKPAGHLGDPNFGDPNGRILLTIQKIENSNNIRIAIKNNNEAGNTHTGLNYLWVNAANSTGVVRYGNGSHDEADVEEVSVIVEFNEPQESYNFINIHWAYAGWTGEWAIDGLAVTPAELCDAAVEPQDPTVAVMGSMNDWAAPIPFTLSDDKTYASLTVEHISADNYEFKFVINGEWRSNGYTYHRNFTGAAGITGNDDANMIFQADQDGQYTFYWYFANDSAAIVYPEYIEPEEPAYYLVGTLNNWQAADEYKFGVDETCAENEYVLHVTLSINDEIKVIKVDGETTTWFPGDGVGNYTIDHNHAGATTVYFRETYNADWEAFGGYFYVVPTGTVDIDIIDADAAAVKVLRDGQILIIKGNKTFNIQGQLVK